MIFAGKHTGAAGEAYKLRWWRFVLCGGGLNRRCRILCLAALFLLAVAAPAGAAGGEIVQMTLDTNTTESVAPCSVDLVPIQLIDGGTWAGKGLGPVTTLSAAQLPSYPPGFKAFVTAVTEYLAAKLAQEKLCLNSAESQERSLVQFVYMPLVTSEDRHQVSTQSLEAQPSSSGCRISSPWVDIAIEREPVPSVQAIVRFNERQLLADQALLAGANNVPPGVAVPLQQTEFSQYVYEYENLERFIFKTMAGSVEDRVPSDLLRLFRYARGLITPAPPRSFEELAHTGMKRAINSGSEDYTKIGIALIDHCFVSAGTDVQYNSILDMADLVPLERYSTKAP